MIFYVCTNRFKIKASTQKAYFMVLPRKRQELSITQGNFFLKKSSQILVFLDGCHGLARTTIDMSLNANSAAGGSVRAQGRTEMVRPCARTP